MKIGLWNIDHPETGSGNETKEKRFADIHAYVVQHQCDIYVITEANAAMHLEGYEIALSAPSPFKSSQRFYGTPNQYHQVAIYSKIPLTTLAVPEPINGLCIQGKGLTVYGNVITIKDQWSKTSSLKYSDRLHQQLEAIQQLPKQRCIVAGDFNMKEGWAQKRASLLQLEEKVKADGWLWPTRNRTDTVDHVLHTPDLNVSVTLDQSINRKHCEKQGLSDHPFLNIEVI
jgi:hypothetical protein